MTRSTILGVAALLLAGCTPSGSSSPPVQSEPTAPPQQIHALGRLEPQGGVLSIGGTTGDRLAVLEVAEGDEVKRDEVLARLDSYTVREAQFKAAQVQLADARRRLEAELDYAKRAENDARLARDQAELGRSDVSVSEAKLRMLSANREQAVRDMERLHGSDSDVVSPQQLEHQKLLVQKAEEELAAAETQHKKLLESVDLAIKAAESQVATAEAARTRVEASAAIPSLEAALALAEAQMNSSVIKAPTAGRILRILTRPGETLGQKPILEMADVSQMIAVAEVDETQVRWVEPGQTAEIESRAFADNVGSLKGTVREIGRTVSKNSLLALDPTQARSDARVVEVQIELESGSVADRLINLQVDVTINTGAPAGSQAEVVTARSSSR